MGDKDRGEPPYSFEFVESPDDLKPYLNSLYILRTPRRLLPQENSVVNNMPGPEGYSSVDLFGGNRDERLGRG